MAKYFLVKEGLLPQVPKNPTKFDEEGFQILQSGDSVTEKAQKLYVLARSELGDKTDVFNDVLELFPKAYKNKVKIILHYIRDANVNTDGSFEVEGNTFSSIVDLLRYVVLPYDKHVPVDGLRFSKYLKSINVPATVFAAKRNISEQISKTPDHKIRWKKISESFSKIFYF